MEYTNSKVREVIGEYIHSERDRKIMIRRLIDDITLDLLSVEFQLSVSQVKRIVWKNSEIVFRHLKEN